jgi:hypothetical protein
MIHKHNTLLLDLRLQELSGFQMRTMVVFLYHHSSAWVTPIYLTVAGEKWLPVHFESVSHKVELLGPVSRIVALM